MLILIFLFVMSGSSFIEWLPVTRIYIEGSVLQSVKVYIYIIDNEVYPESGGTKTSTID